MQDNGGERGSCLQWWPEAGGRRIRVDREGVYEEGMPSMCNRGERGWGAMPVMYYPEWVESGSGG